MERNPKATSKLDKVTQKHKNPNKIATIFQTIKTFRENMFKSNN